MDTEEAINLEAFDDIYNDAEIDMFLDDLPNGRYTAKIEKLYTKYSKEHRPMVVWILKMLSGDKDCIGGKVLKYSMLDEIKHLGRFKTEVKKIGIHLPKLSVLTDEKKEEFLDKVVSITAKNGFVNINKLANIDAVEDDAVNETDNIPF